MIRSPKVIPILAAAGLLALVPAGASALGRAAAKHPSPNGRCEVNINVAPRQIDAGDSLVVFGRLHCGGRSSHGAADKTVKLLEHVAGTPRFKVVQTTTTDLHG